MDEIQQVVVYLAGGNRFNLTPLEMLLEIAEIGGIYPYGMVTVTHLLKFFEGRKIETVTPGEINDYLLYLIHEKNISMRFIDI